jgi:hypothetical protein
MGAIEVWYGDGDSYPLGPIEAVVVDECPHVGLTRKVIRITDKFWLEHIGWDAHDKDYDYECDRIPASHFVRYDDYVWCPPGAGPQPTKWW